MLDRLFLNLFKKKLLVLEFQVIIYYFVSYTIFLYFFSFIITFEDGRAVRICDARLRDKSRKGTFFRTL